MQHLRVTSDGPYTTVTLARPDRRNALSLDVIHELTATMSAIAASDALGVILAAEGPVFSAGHDFADMLDADVDTTRRLFEACTVMMDTVQSMPQVVIARVHALATAAGCQLVASCDLAVAAAGASFALPGGKGGLFCHTPLVPVVRAIGRKRALEMALTGDPIDAVTAADWGLVNRVVPDDELAAATLELLQRATRGSATSKSLGKRTFYDQVDRTQHDAYLRAVEVMAAAAAGPDAQEAIRRFFDRPR